MVLQLPTFLFYNKHIDDIFANKHPDPIIPIKMIAKEFSTNGFSFGNAQKLVNMTAKYLFLSTYNFEGKIALF